MVELKIAVARLAPRFDEKLVGPLVIGPLRQGRLFEGRIEFAMQSQSPFVYLLPRHLRLPDAHQPIPVFMHHDGNHTSLQNSHTG